jgi:hypothetical protein
MGAQNEGVQAAGKARTAKTHWLHRRCTTETAHRATDHGCFFFPLRQGLAFTETGVHLSQLDMAMFMEQHPKMKELASHPVTRSCG